MVGRLLADALIKAGLARRFQWSREAVVFQISDHAAVAHALWLFELSYERRRGLPPTELLGRVREYVNREAPPLKRTRG